MWTGLMRRFSSETGTHDSSSSPTLSSSFDSGYAGDHTSANGSLPKDGVHGVFAPPSSSVRRVLSPFRPPPLDPLVLRGYKDSTPASARLLTPAVAEEIRVLVPERLRISEDWRLVYGLEQDGSSLATLYKKCRAYGEESSRRLGFVLVVKDSEGGIFGAYVNEYFHPSATYFGNGESFLWRASVQASLPPPPSADTTHLVRSTTIASPTRTTFPENHPRAETNAADGTGAAAAQLSPAMDSIRFKAFPYSGENEFFIHCEAGFLSIGAGNGGRYGLWLDGQLEVGHSSRCDTFGNEPLSDEGEKFDVLGVEVWVLGD